MPYKVAIIMGSDSDLNVMKEAAIVLEHFEIPYLISIVSAHRTPKRMYDFVTNKTSEGLQVFIAGAGGAAHLPGMVASLTHLPVIGVPIKSTSTEGIDSLYSIVQMPGGVPVATVAINGAKNAGLLAVQMLAISNPTLSQKYINYKMLMEQEVLTKAEKLELNGWASYLKEKS